MKKDLLGARHLQSRSDLTEPGTGVRSPRPHPSSPPWEMFMKCTPRFALASTLLVTSFMLMGCGSTSTPNSAVSEAAFTPTSPERNNAIRTLAIERKVPVVNARALLARLKAKGYKTRAERRGPV